MAAPHVAGAIAALRSLRPQASLDAIETALKGAGAAIADPAASSSKSYSYSNTHLPTLISDLKVSIGELFSLSK
jgi:hypothetical protein